jgi:ABC-type glutathione transport system ATPase component
MAERDGSMSLASPTGRRGMAAYGGGGPAVRAEGLVKHYDGREGTVEAVRGVDLDVHTGEIFGFLGPTGQASRRPYACSPRC